LETIGDFNVVANHRERILNAANSDLPISEFFDGLQANLLLEDVKATGSAHI